MRSDTTHHGASHTTGTPHAGFRRSPRHQPIPQGPHRGMLPQLQHGVHAAVVFLFEFQQRAWSSRLPVAIGAMACRSKT